MFPFRINTFLIMGIAIVFSISLFDSVSGQESDPQGKALAEIADFADRICSKTSAEGGSSNIELSGNAKVELNKLIKNVVDVGIEGAAKYQESEWQGILQEDLADALKDERNCKLQVFNALKDKLIPASAPADNRSDAEKKSQTSHSLPGDAIEHFRVVESAGTSLVIDVDYTFNSNHGQKVMAGAALSPTSSGYTPTYVPTLGKGTVRIPITLYDNRPSQELSIFLYEWGRPAEAFAERKYSFQRGWGN